MDTTPPLHAETLTDEPALSQSEKDAANFAALFESRRKPRKARKRSTRQPQFILQVPQAVKE